MPREAVNPLKLDLVIRKTDEVNYSKILGDNKRHRRSAISIRENGKMLIIEIKASDLTALRASANSILRNLQVINATRLGYPRKGKVVSANGNRKHP
ncbi:MAG: CTAG/PCC1 family protein [Candidatus Micrarchaeota archaeon]|nr:CTAG/PCC1 family protein [Candidatus Micrarchaeota archaeon]